MAVAVPKIVSLLGELRVYYEGSGRTVFPNRLARIRQDASSVAGQEPGRVQVIFGMLDALEGNTEGVRSRYASAVNLVPDDLVSFHNFAVAFFKVGDMGMAREAFSRAFDLVDGSTDVTNLKAMFHFSRSCGFEEFTYPLYELGRRLGIWRDEDKVEEFMIAESINIPAGALRQLKSFLHELLGGDYTIQPVWSYDAEGEHFDVLPVSTGITDGEQLADLQTELSLHLLSSPVTDNPDFYVKLEPKRG